MPLGFRIPASCPRLSDNCGWLMMDFFDCNVVYGSTAKRMDFAPVPSVDGILSEMGRLGVGRALVRRYEQEGAGVVIGNQLVAEDVRSSDKLWGVWAMLPPHTEELPAPDKILKDMSMNRIAAWQFFGELHGYLWDPDVLKVWFELAVRHRVPLFVDIGRGIGYGALRSVLRVYPDLIVIASKERGHPDDRQIWPVFQDFPGFHYDISGYDTDGGVEATVEKFGPERLLFGSRYGFGYMGAPMLMLKHAQIGDDAKQLIAAGNLDRILQNIKYE